MKNVLQKDNLRVGIDIGGTLLKKIGESVIGEDSWLPGAKEGLKKLCRNYKNRVYIISRVTKSETEKYTRKVIEPFCLEIGLSLKHIFFIPTIEAKVAKARQLGLSIFVDDDASVLNLMVGTIPHLFRFGNKQSPPGSIPVENWERLLYKLFPRLFEQKKKRMQEIIELISRLSYYNYCELRAQMPSYEVKEWEKDEVFKEVEHFQKHSKPWTYKLVMACAKRLGIFEKISHLSDSNQLVEAIISVLKEKEKDFFELKWRIIEMWEGDREMPKIFSEEWWTETKILLLKFGVPEVKIDRFYCISQTPPPPGCDLMDLMDETKKICDEMQEIIERSWK